MCHWTNTLYKRMPAVGFSIRPIQIDSNCYRTICMRASPDRVLSFCPDGSAKKILENKNLNKINSNKLEFGKIGELEFTLCIGRYRANTKKRSLNKLWELIK